MCEIGEKKENYSTIPDKKSDMNAWGNATFVKHMTDSKKVPNTIKKVLY